MLNSIVLRKAVISLMLARIFYTVNWFNIPSIFFFIAVDFDEDISVLGLITASFFIGVGLFQVLAGILASKYSPRKIAILGIAIASTAVFFSAFSIDLFSIAVLRFIVGVGMAFFFGPSVILITEYVGRQSEGLGMGLLNSAHAIGGIIGLFIWVLVAEISVDTSSCLTLTIYNCLLQSADFVFDCVFGLQLVVVSLYASWIYQ